MTKSLTTNLTAIAFAVAGFFLDGPVGAAILSVGLFAFSGALTNWLAIHMLFEKVPGFYGSGVIPARFEDFKEGIHQLIMRQFFTRENVVRFFESGGKDGDSTHSGPDLAPLVDSLNLDPAFEALKTAVVESQFGGALAMFGGAPALDAIKPDFESKMRPAIKEIVAAPEFREKLSALLVGGESENPAEHSELLDRVNLIVEKRLAELAPKMVKEIIQQMIREHLGWLVVWGGVCGGLIGLAASFVQAG